MKNVVLIVENFEVYNQALNNFINRKLKVGYANILMHQTENLFKELHDIKNKISKNDARIVEIDQEQNSIQINQDLKSVVLSDEIITLEEHQSLQDAEIATILKEAELTIIQIHNSGQITEKLIKQLDELPQSYKQLNYYLILKTTNDLFEQSQYDEQCFKNSLDSTLNQQTMDSLLDLVPIQSHKYSQYHETEQTNLNYAFLVQWSTLDHRVDEINKIEELVQMISPNQISGRQINLENLWKEILSRNSKQPKYGA